MGRKSKSERQRRLLAAGLWDRGNSPHIFERNRDFHKSNGTTRKMKQFLEKHKQRLEGSSE